MRSLAMIVRSDINAAIHLHNKPTTPPKKTTNHMF